MNNLYNLVNNFDFYFEAFRNIESNKTFVADTSIINEFNQFLTMFKEMMKGDMIETDIDNIKNKFIKYYDPLLEMLNDLEKDTVFYDKKNAYFSIDLDQGHIEEFKKIYEEMLKDPKENVNKLIRFIEDTIKRRLFVVKINFKDNKKGFEIYNIIFTNLKSQTSSPQNNEEKGLISKNYGIIFGVILEYAKNLNIDFDKNVFSFIGAVEDEKDENTNRRLKAYHMAHKGFLSMRYNDIDEKELTNAFKNNEIHPFLYRVDKDEMYISVSKDVDLTEILDDKKDEEEIDNEEESAEQEIMRRERRLQEFVSDYLNSSDAENDIEEELINLLENYAPQIKNFIEELFPSKNIWNELVINFMNTKVMIENEIDELKNIVKTLTRNFSIESVEDLDDNEELFDILRESSVANSEILDLIDDKEYDVPEVYSMLKNIEEERNRDIVGIFLDTVSSFLDTAEQAVEQDFYDAHYNNFMNSEYEDEM